MKLLFHIIVFFAGAGLGLWYGVYHPVEAARVANIEQQAADRISQKLNANGVNTGNTTVVAPAAHN